MLIQKPTETGKIVCVKQTFTLNAFVLTRFNCIYSKIILYIINLYILYIYIYCVCACLTMCVKFYKLSVATMNENIIDN